MHKPLYTYPLRIAREQNEVDIYTENKEENIACKNGIEWMLRTNFDGMHLHGECAKELCDKYGMDRVAWVLANTVQHQTWDGRFRPHTREWADKFLIPTAAEDMTTDYCVSSHPEIVNGLIDQYRSYVQSVDVLNTSACIYGSRNDDYEGKLMVLRPLSLSEEYRTSENQYFFADSGLGCNPDKRCGEVFGRFLIDGEATQFRRGDFLGEADSYGLPEWAKQKLQELNDISENDDCFEMGGM